METLSALLSLCAGNPPVTGGFPSQRDSNVYLWCVFSQSRQPAEQTLDGLVIRDAMTVIWRRRI